MASVINILDPSRVVSHTTTKVVRQLEAVGNQSIAIQLHGLNINTHLNLYVDNKKANTSSIVMQDRPGETFSTNSNGVCNFVFYYQEDFTQLNNVPEAKYSEFLAKNTGNLLYIQRSYSPTLQTVEDVIVNEIPG